jgi:hypothetical protein
VSPNAPHIPSLVGKIAGLSRAVKTGEREPSDPELAEARRDLCAAQLAAHIKRLCDAEPPFTAAQRKALTALIT